VITRGSYWNCRFSHQLVCWLRIYLCINYCKVIFSVVVLFSLLRAKRGKEHQRRQAKQSCPDMEINCLSINASLQLFQWHEFKRRLVRLIKKFSVWKIRLINELSLHEACYPSFGVDLEWICARWHVCFVENRRNNYGCCFLGGERSKMKAIFIVAS
jgi:hypothetical protein